MESLLIALAVNTNQYNITLDKIPDTQYSLSITVEGNVAVYNVSRFLHRNYPGMDPIVCLYQEYPNKYNNYFLCTVSRK